MDEIGNLLKEVRESSGVTIEEAGKDISVKTSVLENIEAGKIGAFKDVFELKSIIANYSKYLGLNSDEMIDKFNSYLFEYTSKIPVKEIEKTLNDLNKKDDTTEMKVVSPYTKENSVSYTKYYVLISILIVILAIIGFWWAKNQVSINTISTNTIAYYR